MLPVSSMLYLMLEFIFSYLQTTAPSLPCRKLLLFFLKYYLSCMIIYISIWHAKHGTIGIINIHDNIIANRASIPSASPLELKVKINFLMNITSREMLIF